MRDASAIHEEYSNQLLRCSFCAKTQSDVEKLVAGPGVFICDKCVGLCNDVIAESPAPPKDAEFRHISYLETVATDDLKSWLGNVERLRSDVNLQQQMAVDVLRSRKVSWAEIGKTLGITRQAAWQRFGAADSVGE